MQGGGISEGGPPERAAGLRRALDGVRGEVRSLREAVEHVTRSARAIPAPAEPTGAPLVVEQESPSWGPPAVDLPPEAAFAEDEAMSTADIAQEPDRSDADARPRPGSRREPTLADAAADAIDRLARTLFGPKRPRR